MSTVGLALSGGGFRAAFFELGALAWLAENRKLMDVGAISSVSGGSILAALYHLHVKELLEAKHDGDVRHEDYVDIVERTHLKLVAAVQTNLRLRTFARFRSNVRMFWTTYSRTDRLGDLLDTALYRAGPSAGMRKMVHLAINPKDGNFDNNTRRAKLPELILNATVLQTGRRWEFTQAGLGEPSTEDEAAVGTPQVLVPFRPYADFAGADMPGSFAPPSDFEVGYAVAASAAVPGIFHPMTVSGVTPEGAPTPLLVDGGVVDNQGVDALLSRGVETMIAVDAGGQLTADTKVRAGVLSSVFRSSDIQYGRVRYAQLIRMYERGPARNRIVHIRLPGIGEPAAGPVQQIRTDLDAFSDIEVAYLMRHGYRAAADVMTPDDNPIDGGFDFNDPALDPPSKRVVKRLSVGRRQLGKVFSMSLLAWLATLVFGAALLALASPFLDGVYSLLTRDVHVWVLLAVIAGGVLYLRMRWVRKLVGGLPLVRQISWDWLVGIARMLAAVLSWVFVGFSLLVLNPLFLRAGKLDRP
ncbi:MAG: patatin-like phospholipase family protein [Actinomycetota bacterium]